MALVRSRHDKTERTNNEHFFSNFDKITKFQLTQDCNQGGNWLRCYYVVGEGKEIGENKKGKEKIFEIPYFVLKVNSPKSEEDYFKSIFLYDSWGWSNNFGPHISPKDGGGEEHPVRNNEANEFWKKVDEKFECNKLNVYIHIYTRI